MSGIEVRQADIEDWNGVKHLWRNLKESPHAMRIEGDESVLKSFFIGSLTSPYVGCWVSLENDIYTGFVITQIQQNPVPDRKGMITLVPACFIRAVYVDNRIASPETVGILDSELCKFSKTQGCVCVLGNCRTDFPARAALKQYGYGPTYLVMRKDL